MESIGVFSDGEWYSDSFSKMFSTGDDQEIDFSQQFTFPLENVDDGIMHFNEAAAANVNFVYDSNLFYGINNTSFFNIPNETNAAYFYSDHSNSNHNVATTNDVSMSMDICMDEKNVPFFDTTTMEETVTIREEDMMNKDELLKRKKFDVQGDDENVKKKPRVQRTKKNAQSKKNQNLKGNYENGEEIINNNGGSEGQSSSTSYCSEDENAVASQETNNNNGGTIVLSESKVVNLNGKPRASRGSATDPQSLYARKRRERINERLKTLQTLVPNGTKVDISTMLEEAVNYVKFLQLQIKLLSSDDMWMYAPLAYNGIDLCLNQKFSSSFL